MNAVEIQRQFPAVPGPIPRRELHVSVSFKIDLDKNGQHGQRAGRAGTGTQSDETRSPEYHSELLLTARTLKPVLLSNMHPNSVAHVYKNIDKVRRSSS